MAPCTLKRNDMPKHGYSPLEESKLALVSSKLGKRYIHCMPITAFTVQTTLPHVQGARYKHSPNQLKYNFPVTQPFIYQCNTISTLLNGKEY